MSTIIDTETPAPVADVATTTPEILPIAGTVPAKKANKAKKGKFHLVRDWYTVEENLTETQGQMLQTLQEWTLAERDAGLMGRLEASQMLDNVMYECKRGTLESFASDSHLSTREAEAFQTVYRVWKRWAKKNTQDAREQSDRRHAAKKAEKAKKAPATS